MQQKWRSVKLFLQIYEILRNNVFLFLIYFILNVSRPERREPCHLVLEFTLAFEFLISYKVTKDFLMVLVYLSC